jgi:post-segregation antitoxin (ccd killing protein)
MSASTIATEGLEEFAMTDVTIRGIDDDVYSRFAAEAKKRGIPIGELATKAMSDLIKAAQAPSYHLENLEHLSVSRSDLESIDGPIVFSDIEVLEFEDDVDWNVFKVHVERIQDVEKILVPKGLSKFQVLTKSSNVEQVKSK